MSYFICSHFFFSTTLNKVPINFRLKQKKESQGKVMTKIATLCFAGHLLLSSLFLICGGYEAWTKLLRIKHISRYLLHPASLGDRSYYCLLLFNMVVVPIIFFWYHFSSLKSPPPLFSNTLCFKAQTSPSSSCRLPRWF